MGAGASLSGGYYVSHKELMEELQKEAARPLDASDITNFEEAKKEVIRVRQLMFDARSRLTSEKQVFKPYEKKETTLDDGTHITLNEDGSKVVKKPEGTVITTYADGTVKQANPNGVSITKKPDGTVFQEHADGSSIEKQPDGTMIHVSAKGEKLEVAPDGSKKQTMADGTVVQRYKDGTSMQTNPDGCRIVMYPDGRKMQHNANGTIIETNPDGYKVQTMVDGSKFEFFANGTRIDTMATGEVVETHADGTVLRRKIETSVCINCSQCNTIINASRGTFIVSCPICRHIMTANQQKTPGGLASVSEDAATSGGREAELEQMFRNYDQNNDNVIDPSELGKLLEALNLAPNAFPEVLQAAAGGSDRLDLNTFPEYISKLQAKMIETAQAPMIEMTKTLLEEQKAELERQKQKLMQENKKLQDKVAKGEAEEKAISEKEANEKMLQRIAAAYETKSKQLNNTIEEQKRRQQALLHERVKRRKSSAATSPRTPSRPSSGKVV